MSGLIRSNLVMGKHSGRHAFKKKLEDLGYGLGENALNDAFIRFKSLADKKKEIFDEDLVALVDDGIQTTDQRVRFVSLRVAVRLARSSPRPSSSSRSTGCRSRREATGDGPVDATFKAIREIYPHEAGLPLFQIHAVTEGTDAQAEVTVRLEERGKTVTGQAADTDTLVASARAYIARAQQAADQAGEACSRGHVGLTHAAAPPRPILMGGDSQRTGRAGRCARPPSRGVCVRPETDPN